MPTADELSQRNIDFEQVPRQSKWPPARSEAAIERFCDAEILINFKPSFAGQWWREPQARPGSIAEADLALLRQAATLGIV